MGCRRVQGSGWLWLHAGRVVRMGTLAAMVWMVALPALALPNDATRLPGTGGATDERTVPAETAAAPIPPPTPVAHGEGVSGDTLLGGAIPWSSLTAPPTLGAMMQGGGGSGPTFEYYALDALGSVRVVFDAAGAVKARADYEPFGAPIATSTTGPLPREQFTGQQRDGEVGLDYFGARFYHATHGRMLSVDPLYVGAVHEPQRWNRYAYALNSPTLYIDPDGRTGCTTTVRTGGFTVGCPNGGSSPSPPSGPVFSYGVSTFDFMGFSSNEAYYLSQYGYIPEFGSQTVGFPVNQRSNHAATDGGATNGQVASGTTTAVAETITANPVVTTTFFINLVRTVSQSQAVRNAIAAAQLAAQRVSVSATGFGSLQKGLEHWSKHRAEFPELGNALQYFRMAKDFFGRPPAGVLTKARGTDLLQYHPATNTFGVRSSNGVIRTVFRPVDGIEYWRRQ